MSVWALMHPSNNLSPQRQKRSGSAPTSGVSKRASVTASRSISPLGNPDAINVVDTAKASGGRLLRVGCDEYRLGELSLCLFPQVKLAADVADRCWLRGREEPAACPNGGCGCRCLIALRIQRRAGCHRRAFFVVGGRVLGYGLDPLADIKASDDPKPGQHNSGPANHQHGTTARRRRRARDFGDTLVDERFMRIAPEGVAEWAMV